MPYCPRCGKEVAESAAFCPSCGAPQGVAVTGGGGAGWAPAGAPTEEDLRAFVGPNAERYLPRFGRFSMAGIDNFAVTWHWPAFFVPFLWMLYRKLYLWAAVALLTDLIFPPAHLLWGILANYLYFREAKRKVAQVRAANPGADVSLLLAEVGGVNRWVWPLAFIVAALGLILLAVLGLIGCLAFLGLGHCGGAGGFVTG